MNEVSQLKRASSDSLIHPEFESLVEKLMQSVESSRLKDLRKDFHTRLRITLTHPDQTELLEDLWDFFYDWCVFENFNSMSSQFPENLVQNLKDVKAKSSRGLFTVTKISSDGIRLKELFSNEVLDVPQRVAGTFVGISKGDFIEGRLLSDGADKKPKFSFVRRPSFHPVEVHDYIKEKIKQFRKTKDVATYQTWLWLLVGMYLKHRLYEHMPVEKIYDDNSRI